MSSSEYLKSTEARAEFGWSRNMMTKLLKSGTLQFTTDPLDKRIKWVQRREVARLDAASRKQQQRQQPPALPVGASARAPSAVQRAGAPQTTAEPVRPATRAAKQPQQPPPPPRQLKLNDQVVLNYLRALCLVSGTHNTTAPVGYATIARHCGICPRQAQVCCSRLVAGGHLQRVGCDVTNPDRKQRGTVYRVRGRRPARSELSVPALPPLEPGSTDHS